MLDVKAILAFTVVIPFLAGIRLLSPGRMSATLTPIVLLCGFWTLAEIYCYVLRIQDIPNAHVSYVLSIIEFYFFALFYTRACPSARRFLLFLFPVGIAFVVDEYFILGTPLNTFSLALEYIVFTSVALYLLFEQLTDRASSDLSVINLTFIFYFLSSFPYFFAWEWLRITDIALLKLFSDVHAVVHAVCYLILARKLWISSSYFLARS